MQPYTDVFCETINSTRARSKFPEKQVTVSEDGKSLLDCLHYLRPKPLRAPERAVAKLRYYQPFVKRISDWSNIVVAGGSVARSLFWRGYDFVDMDGDKLIDADIYLYGIRDEEHLNATVQRLCSDLRPAWMLRTNALITMGIGRTEKARKATEKMPSYIAQHTCQVILLKAETIEDIMDTFDIDESCVAYDGSSIVLHPRAVQAFESCVSMLRPELASNTLFKRLFKYQSFTAHTICIPFEAAVRKYEALSWPPQDNITHRDPILRFGRTEIVVSKSLGYASMSYRFSDAGREEEGDDPRDSGDYGALIPPSAVIEKMQPTPVHALISVVHMLRWAERAGREVAFSWDPSTALGASIQALVDAPGDNMPRFPLTPAKMVIFSACFPDDLIVSTVRQDRAAFAAAFAPIAEKLKVMRAAFWEKGAVPALRLGSRAELFGRVGCTPEEMLV